MLLALQPARAATFTVTNTNDSGPGSLRWAIEQANANPGPDTIAFNIPTTDPGYDAATGVWMIRPTSELPILFDDGTTIDGTTQAAFIGGDPNPYGPEVEINGLLAGSMVAGLTLASAANTVRGLVINSFTQTGILVKGADNLIAGNYIKIYLPITLRISIGSPQQFPILGMVRS